MPRAKRFFPVSHDLVHDPELWQFLKTEGDRALLIWLWILSGLDRTENQFRLAGDWLATASRSLRQTTAKVRRCLGQLSAMGWLTIDGDLAGPSPIILSSPNYMKYHNTQVRKKNETDSTEGRGLGTLLTKPNHNKNYNPFNSPQAPISKSKSAPKHFGDVFEKIWAAWPKKQGKLQAVKTWNHLVLNPDLLQKIRDGLEVWEKSEQWTKDGGKFVPMLSTWLNQRRWEDELPNAAKAVTKEVELAW